MAGEMETHAPILEVESVEKRFGGVAAVHDVSMTVKKGARHGVIGPNGAGKTTLFNLITGSVYADRGQIRMFGRDVTRSPLQRRVALGLGRTYQITETFGTLTVRENLALAMFGLGRRQLLSLRPWRSVDDCSARVESLALRFGLRPHCDHLVSELSHGEVRQLDIALAMAQHPRLLLLDEPGAGLSTGERMEIRAVLKALPRDITFIIIEHDMDMLRDVADWTTVLHSGQVIAEGPHDVVAGNAEVRAVYLGAEL